MIKFVYFDLGGVVMSDLTATDGWSKMKKDLGVTPDQDAEFEKFYDDYEAKVCTGLDIDTIIPILRSRFKLNLSENYSMLTDFVDRFERNEYIWPVIEAVKKKCRIGLLTNIYPRLLEAIKNRGLMPLVDFDVIIDSSVEKVQKPDVKIFEIAQDKCGFRGDEIFYIENTKRNVAVAQSLGWRTFWYDSSDYEGSAKKLADLTATLF